MSGINKLKFGFFFYHIRLHQLQKNVITFSFPSFQALALV